MKVKKVFSILMLGVMASSFLAVFSPMRAHAADCQATFFGMPSWCRGLTDQNGKMRPIGYKGSNAVPIPNFIWTVVGNLGDGLFRIIGVVSVGFVIWGGIQYTLAYGDTGKLGNAKKTIINALAGLVISILASTIVNLVMGLK